MNHTKRYTIIITSLMIFVLSFGTIPAQETEVLEKPEIPAARDVQQLTATLEKITAVYSHDRGQLEKSRKEVEKLRRKAEGAKDARVGVALFGNLSGILQRYFIAASPDGLLQDVYQEALFDTQAMQEEKEQFQSWMGRNFLRRKELKKNYELLEQVLKSQLEKNPGSYPDKITRRLNWIIQTSKELSRQIGESMAQLETDRREVEKMVRQLRSGPKQADVQKSGQPDTEKVKEAQ